MSEYVVFMAALISILLMLSASSCCGRIRGPARGVSQVACRNFKMSRVGVLSRLHNAVGNLATYIWLRQPFVAISLSLLFGPCRLSEFTLAGPRISLCSSSSFANFEHVLF